MNQTSQSNTPLRALAEILGLAVLYFVTARLGQQLAIPPGNVTPVWIPSGIILVAVLLRGNGIWPGIWLGAFAGNIWAYLDWQEFSNLGISLLSGTANGIGDTLCATVGAHLILKAAGTTKPFDSGVHVFQFILYGALVGSAISAVFGVTGLAIVGFIPWSDYMYVWLTWLVGDAVGVLLMAPLLLTLSDWFKKDWVKETSYRELVAYVMCLVVVTGLSLNLFAADAQLPLPLFIVLPVLLWGVFKFKPHLSIFSVIAVAVAAIIVTALGEGPFSGVDINIALIELQLFLFTIMTTVFVLVGVLQERHKIEEGVQISEERYRRLLDQSAGGIIIVDENGCIESFNVKAEQIFGYEAAEVVGRNVSYLTPTSIRNMHQTYFDEYDHFRQSVIFGAGRQVVARHRDGHEFPLYIAISESQNCEKKEYFAVVHDISEQVKIESELKASEEKFKLLANSSFEALIVINKNVVVSVNEPFKKMFGYEADDLIGKPIKKKLFTTDLVFLEGQGGVIESEGIRKHGARFPIEVQQKTEQINNELLKIISIRDRSAFFMQQMELKKARDQAINANHSKSKFLSAMSHELRTPMNAIIGFSQLLDMNKGNLTEPQEESVREIRSAGKHLLGLIDDILDLSKIEAGKFVVNMADVQLNQVVTDCVELIKPLADGRGIKVFNHFVEAKPFIVRADAFRLKQVVLNLLSNAVKYNHADGTVTISAEVTNLNRLRLSITDSGVGLTEDDQEKIFEPFERIHAEGGHVEGTGIGLVITKNLVEMMGGAIGVESYRYIGSTFWVELELVEGEVEVPVDYNGMERRAEKIEAESLKINASNTGGLEGRTILYIEDEPANLRLVQQVVAKLSSAKLITAVNGATGIELARREKPDVILLDVNLPGLDGYQVATRLGKFPETADIPIIGVSANALDGDIEMGMQSGFSEYLTKPIDVGLLMAALEKFVSQESDK